MPPYSHHSLTFTQKLKATWRSYKQVAKAASDMVEREGLSFRQASKLASDQHNEKVRRMREENDRCWRVEGEGGQWKWHAHGPQGDSHGFGYRSCEDAIAAAKEAVGLDGQ